jgi:hypothetical protein
MENNSGTLIVTIPKALARKHKIRAGSEIIWSESESYLKFRRL